MPDTGGRSTDPYHPIEPEPASLRFHPSFWLSENVKPPEESRPHVSAIAVMKTTFWSIQHLMLLLAGFWLAWAGLAQVDFGYPLAYQWLDIRGHIDTFGPQNRYRAGYQTLDNETHLAHFSAIVDAIHHDGRGLEAIGYLTPDGRRSTLLRPPEILHLQDVAHLVTLWWRAGLMATLLWLGGLLWIQRRGWKPPAPARVAAGGVTLVAVAGTAVVAVGPVKVFYAAHNAVFPPGHEWFFYYQDSLMTTLMKAPDLFGFIAVLWVMVSGVVIAGGITAQRRAALAGRLSSRADANVSETHVRKESGVP